MLAMNTYGVYEPKLRQGRKKGLEKSFQSLLFNLFNNNNHPVTTQTQNYPDATAEWKDTAQQSFFFLFVLFSHVYCFQKLIKTRCVYIAGDVCAHNSLRGQSCFSNHSRHWRWQGRKDHMNFFPRVSFLPLCIHFCNLFILFCFIHNMWISIALQPPMDC